MAGFGDELGTMIFLAAILIGLIPAIIARNKGRDFISWWLFGAALFIVALPWAIMLKRDVKAIEAAAIATGDSRKCAVASDHTSVSTARAACAAC